MGGPPKRIDLGPSAPPASQKASGDGPNRIDLPPVVADRVPPPIMPGPRRVVLPEPGPRALERVSGGHSAPPPNHPTAPPQSAPVGPSRGPLGDSRFATVLAAAQAKAPDVAALPRFVPRLRRYLDAKPAEWAMGATANLTTVAEALASAANDISTANAPHWVDELRTAYQGHQSILSRFTGKEPSYYKTMLVNAQNLLALAMRKYTSQKDTITSIVEVATLDLLAVQVITPTLTDASDQILADGRLRTLATTQMTAGQFLQTINTSQMLISKQLTDIEQMLTNILPMWIAARGSR